MWAIFGQLVSFKKNLQFLLYLSVSTHAVIGQFSGLYLKLFLLLKCFVIYHQVFLTFLVSKSLKLSFISEIVY